MIEAILRRLHGIEKRLRELATHEHGGKWIYPNSSEWAGTANTPLTSTSWDGDSYSTTAKTLIDLSSVFSVPAGVKAVLVRLAAKDEASAAGTNILIVLAPNNTASQGPLWLILDGIANDHYHDADGIVPCDSNGDIYYQIAASGASTMDVVIQIWGYQL